MCKGVKLVSQKKKKNPLSFLPVFLFLLCFLLWYLSTTSGRTVGEVSILTKKGPSQNKRNRNNGVSMGGGIQLLGSKESDIWIRLKNTDFGKINSQKNRKNIVSGCENIPPAEHLESRVSIIIYNVIFEQFGNTFWVVPFGYHRGLHVLDCS